MRQYIQTEKDQEIAEIRLLLREWNRSPKDVFKLREWKERRIAELTKQLNDLLAPHI